EVLVRRAATLSKHLPERVQARAYLLGLGVGLDRTAALTEHRLLAPLAPRLETPAERDARIRQLGVPTAYGRHELARHFWIAAALPAVVGPAEAESSCLALQLRSAAQPGPFSAQMYQADLAGIVFAHRLLTGRLKLADL